MTQAKQKCIYSINDIVFIYFCLGSKEWCKRFVIKCGHWLIHVVFVFERCFVVIYDVVEID